MSNPYQSSEFPAPPMGGGGAKPDNYLVYSIMATLCCCLPGGIVAIVYAAQVDSKWNGGDHEGAHAAAKNAKMWCMISAACGILAMLVQIAVIALSEAGAAGGGF